MSSFKELIVWQKSYQLTKDTYFLTKSFPKEELFSLVSQMRRSSLSIPSNIAEGYTRRGRKEFTQFLYIAYGSGAELDTQLLLAKDMEYISDTDYQKTHALLVEIMKMLNVLISKTNG